MERRHLLHSTSRHGCLAVTTKRCNHFRVQAASAFGGPDRPQFYERLRISLW